MNRFQLTLLCLLFFLSFTSLSGQIEQVIVETYYIADANDATDTDGGYLEEGSVTYRIFVDLLGDSRLTRLFGDSIHPFIISSSDDFFNHEDRGVKYGYNVPYNPDIGINRLRNGTNPLDTWITMGFASTQHLGIPKGSDADGSIIGGENNDGGSEHIPGGLLVNDDPEAGIPLTVSDGLELISDTIPAFFEYGISDTSIFVSRQTPLFNRTIDLLNSAEGIRGDTAENRVLIAQLTTKGEVRFELNLEIIDTTGNAVRYFARNEKLGPEGRYSRWLSYPFIAGCTDPYFLEYDPEAVLDDGSCLTEIVLGCTDPSACNYDPSANFNIQEICCYSAYNCGEGDRRIELVCPNFQAISDVAELPDFRVYPVPVYDFLNLRADSEISGELHILVQDIYGRMILQESTEVYRSTDPEQLDVSGIPEGIYLLKIRMNDTVFVKQFLKN